MKKKWPVLKRDCQLMSPENTKVSYCQAQPIIRFRWVQFSIRRIVRQRNTENRVEHRFYVKTNGFFIWNSLTLVKMLEQAEHAIKPQYMQIKKNHECMLELAHSWNNQVCF